VELYVGFPSRRIATASNKHVRLEFPILKVCNSIYGRIDISPANCKACHVNGKNILDHKYYMFKLFWQQSKTFNYFQIRHHDRK